MLVWTELTADGETVLGSKQNFGELVLLCRGSFGGGTLSLGYLDHLGVFQVFGETAALTQLGERLITLGRGTTLVASLAGSTTPSLFVGVSSEQFAVDNGLTQVP